MRLIRFAVTLTVVGLLVYFAVAVPLGEKTLWEHLRSIAGSKEGQDLVGEVKQKANRMLHRDAGAPGSGAGTSTAAGEGAGTGSDNLTARERRLLRELIKEKLGKKSGGT